MTPKLARTIWMTYRSKIAKIAHGRQIYLSYLLPIIDYSCVVWDGCTERDIESLQKLQNEAARIVTGLTRSVSLDNLYKESGWVSLIERRKQQKLIFMYKSVNGLIPSYVSKIGRP